MAKYMAKVEEAYFKQIDIGGQPKVLAVMKMKTADEEENVFYFESFITKKDGTLNTYCENQLKAAGFGGFNNAAHVGALHKGEWEECFELGKILKIETEVQQVNDKTYEKIKWVNDPSASGGARGVVDLSILEKQLGLSINSINVDEEIPF